MKITISKQENGVKYIVLEGMLDMQGYAEIELKFTAYAAAEKAGVVVDLSQVSFLASIGIRLLLSSARALMLRGGKMALLSPQPQVASVLATSGIHTVIPIFTDLEAACIDVIAGMKA